MTPARHAPALGPPAARPWGRVLRHAAAWAAWALFVGLEYSQAIWVHGEPRAVLVGLVATLLVAAVAGYYFFAEVVLPRWLLRRRWALTALGLGAIYYVAALLFYAYFHLLARSGRLPASFAPLLLKVMRADVGSALTSWRVLGISLADFTTAVLPPILLRFVRFLLSTSNRSLQLERENLNLEVNFLKAQVNPHFLFNTLNNIYTLVVKQDARAPAAVQHLADLLHYTVYEAAGALVPLAQEIAFLEDYLELERLRYGQKVRIDYRLTGDPAGWGLTPLLCFPFVENAFKHGADSSLDAAWVAIEVAVRGPELHLAVRNSYSPGAPKRAFGGVGLANVRQRLALHYAPHDYRLAIDHAADAYHVSLTLRLGPLAAAPAPAPSLVAP